MKILSRAKACRIRGAPIILVSADESVVAKIPALTSILENATSLIIRWFETSSAGFGDRPTGIL